MTSFSCLDTVASQTSRLCESCSCTWPYRWSPLRACSDPLCRETWDQNSSNRKQSEQQRLSSLSSTNLIPRYFYHKQGSYFEINKYLLCCSLEGSGKIHTGPSVCQQQLDRMSNKILKKGCPYPAQPQKLSACHKLTRVVFSWLSIVIYYTTLVYCFSISTLC